MAGVHEDAGRCEVARIDALVASVRAALDADGFAVRAGVGRDAYAHLCQGLGEIVGRTAVRLDPTVQTYLCSPKPVVAHTDADWVDVIAWRCVRQDADDGANLLIDARAAVLGLPDSARDALARVRLVGPSLRGAAAVWTPGSAQVFWAPWLTPQTPDAEAAKALRAFMDALAAAPVRRIRLAPHEVLVVDNTRTLHGRDALPPTSRRLLDRRWLVAR